MCIIVYKEAGEKRIPKRIFDKCWKNNFDGAGYAIWNKEREQWKVRKGLMTFKDFWEAHQEENVTKETRAIFHFRIGTSGKEVEALTHPFPVTDDIRRMGELEYYADNLVFHNGVIGKGEKDSKGFEWSDTCVAIRDYIDPLHPYLDDDKIFNFMDMPLETNDNRWIVTKGEQVFMYGKWLEEDGIEYSNDTYKNDRQWATETEDYVVGRWGAPYAGGEFTKANGTFDWEKWEARGSKQTELPWSQVDVPPNEDEEDSDDNTVIISIDPNGRGIPERTYNEDRAIDYLCCPNCYQDKYLDNSPFSVGDTICLICGCVFDDLTGAVITFDRDLQKKWNEKLKEASNG